MVVGPSRRERHATTQCASVRYETQGTFAKVHICKLLYVCKGTFASYIPPALWVPCPDRTSFPCAFHGAVGLFMRIPLYYLTSRLGRDTGSRLAARIPEYQYTTTEANFD